MNKIYCWLGAIIVMAIITHSIPSDRPEAITSGKVIVSWDANTEPDLAGYKIYWGLNSRSYNHQRNVGNKTADIIDGLELGRRWYFAVTAYDSANNESDYSTEVSIFLADSSDTSQIQIHFSYYNFPNPFNPYKEWTSIRYYLTVPQMVSISIFDNQDNLIVNLLQNAWRSPGEHFEGWNGYDKNGRIVKNGIYVAVISIDGLKRFVQIAVLK